MVKVTTSLMGYFILKDLSGLSFSHRQQYFIVIFPRKSFTLHYRLIQSLAVLESKYSAINNH